MRKNPTIYDVFTDASVTQHKNAAGLGWVIYKQPKGGRFIKAGAKKVTGKNARKINLCEIMAASEALQRTAKKSVINLHSDDQDLVKLVNDPAALRERIAKTNKPELAEAYRGLQQGLERHHTVRAIGSSPDISQFFCDAHDLSRVAANMEKGDIRRSKEKFEQERSSKAFRISLYF